MNGSAKPRLSLMMFLQYAVWGAWLPLAARFLQAGPDEGGLGFTGFQVGMILGLAGSVGAVTSPFIAGQVADRYFSAEKFLALLLAVGGVVKWYTAYQTTYPAWLILSIVYSVVYMPTLALSNSVAFANLSDKKRDFPKVRVWGTFGWIAASWIFPMIWLQTDLKFQAMPPFLSGPEVDNVTGRLVDALKFSGMISIGYAAFCFLLPNTPPKRDAVEPLAVAKAFALFRKPSFALLVLASLPISVIHQIYFMQTGPFLSAIGLRDSLIGPVMTIGQFAEIGVMAALGLMLKRLGFRWVIFIGAMAYFARYAVFGTVDLPLGVIVTSQALHGFCYACFFAAGFIYVDRLATDDIRHSVQTVYGIIILGLGPVLGGFLLGWLESAFRVDGVWDYSKLWYTLGAIGLVTGLAIAALFRDETPPDAETV
jgi:nucleoside transporter